MKLESNWISVKDCLPDNNDNHCDHDVVLVFGINDTMGTYALAQWYKEGWHIVGDIGGTDCIGEWTFEPESITHWMRLPDAPNR